LIRTTLDESFEVVETITQVLDAIDGMDPEQVLIEFDLLDPDDAEDVQVALNPDHIVSVSVD